MRRNEIDELHYITPIANVSSILEFGILSHELAREVEHDTVADPEVQRLRAAKSIQGLDGRRHALHSFVNLYFNARNPMMYVRQREHSRLCVLRVAPTVLDLEGAYVTDMNAARMLARIEPAEEGLAMIDRRTVFAGSWQGQTPEETEHRKGVMCAEVLVPLRIDPSVIIGAYVSGPMGLHALRTTAPQLRAMTHPDLFFLWR